MTLPNSFIVGAPRCGTTSVHHYISQHPEVYVPRSRKELGWFTDEHGRVASFDLYQELFEAGAAKPCRLDVSTSYLYPRGTAEAIRATCGAEVRIVIFMRNPAEAAYSLWQFEVAHGFETLDFLSGIAAESRRLSGELPIGGWPPNSFYQQRYRYYNQVRRYINVFGRERVHLVIYERLFEDLRRGWRELCDFLKIDRNFEPTDLGARLNAGGRPRSARIREFLAAPPPALRRAARRLPSRWRWRAVAAMQRFNIITAPRTNLSPERREFVLSLFEDDLQELQKLVGFDLREIWH